MKIIFKSMDKDKKILNEKNVVEYKFENETPMNMVAECNKYIFPIISVNENSNLDSIGYIKEKNILFIQYKEMKKSVEGFELGMRPEQFGYFYHDVHELVYNNLINSKNKTKFIKDYIQKKYMFHREPIGVEIPLMQDKWAA